MDVAKLRVAEAQSTGCCPFEVRTRQINPTMMADVNHYIH
jgi:hypothetical protein